MTELQNIIHLDNDGLSRLARIVVVDHPTRTDIYGADATGEAITERFSSPGNLPWGAILNLAMSEASWSIGQPGEEDVDPETGAPRYTFPAVTDRTI